LASPVWNEKSKIIASQRLFNQKFKETIHFLSRGERAGISSKGAGCQKWVTVIDHYSLVVLKSNVEIESRVKII
jgi:hypothetical protein